MQLDIEKVAVAKDDTAVERRAEIERDLADLNEQFAGMKAQWEREKEQAEGHGDVLKRLDEARTELQRAERETDYELAAKLRHSEIPQLEQRLAEAESRGPSDEPPVYLSEKVDADEVAEVVARWTGIPVSRMLEGEVEKLVHMEERLHQRVIGQDEAVTAVSDALRRSRAGLSDPDRPIGTFLFLGPTGVGKTELARALAEFMFDSQDAMVRIDMSEYMEKHSVARLVGAPPGYVGYEEGGQLTESVRRRPYSVVLLDEIEKAHSDVFNVLLQVMDDGRLTDGQGRTVDFKNAVLIMTSNIPGGRAGVETHFRPEFVNRLDDIVEFDSLSRAELGRIVDLQVARLIGRVSERGVTVELTDGARELLGNMGYDPTYGARPLKRVIQKRLVDPLALGLLKGDYAAGDAVLGRRAARRPAVARLHPHARGGRPAARGAGGGRGRRLAPGRRESAGDGDREPREHARGLGAVGLLIIDLQRPAPERGVRDRDLAALDGDPAARALRGAERDRLAHLALAHVVREDLGPVDEAAAEEAHPPRRLGLARLQPQRERRDAARRARRVGGLADLGDGERERPLSRRLIGGGHAALDLAFGQHGDVLLHDPAVDVDVHALSGREARRLHGHRLARLRVDGAVAGTERLDGRRARRLGRQQGAAGREDRDENAHQGQPTPHEAQRIG